MNAPEMYSLMQGVTGVNAFAATCQSALETGRWTSKLWLQARNGAGMKTDTNWLRDRKPYVFIMSQEWNKKEKEMELKRGKFRAYITPEDFAQDYGKKIREFYPACVASADNFWGYFSGLYDGRWGAWATDPIYFTKLSRMAAEFAPEILGQGWRGRMLLALNLAKDRGTLNDYQRKAAEKILREVGEA